MATYTDYTKYVASKLTERDLLEQLAEEASELSQAAMKLIRASKMNANYTPIKEDDAREKLVEEFMDVLIVGDVLVAKSRVLELVEEISNIMQKPKKKVARWAKRLGYEEERQ